VKRQIVFITETVQNRLTQPIRELIDFGASLIPDHEYQSLLIVPGQNVSELAEQISSETGIHTLAIEHEDLMFPNPHLLGKILPPVIRKNIPSCICMSHNVRSCHVAASLAINIRAACITGVESYEIQNSDPVFTRMMFNGKLAAKTVCKTEPIILTVIPGAFSDTLIPHRKNGNRETDVMKTDAPTSEYLPKRVYETIDRDNLLEEADVIVSAGMGIEKKENMELIRQTASMFTNAAIAGSRIVCDHGWLPYGCQVGETGKQVAPKLYIACGISGTMQHTAGMKKSNCIVAINKDPNAPIFSIADYGVIEDLKTFLPILVSKYDEQKN
jgi:electron transfer flavoprotein alpha subunit